jgi:hypothetical protein
MGQQGQQLLTWLTGKVYVNYLLCSVRKRVANHMAPALEAKHFSSLPKLYTLFQSVKSKVVAPVDPSLPHFCLYIYMYIYITDLVCYTNSHWNTTKEVINVQREWHTMIHGQAFRIITRQLFSSIERSPHISHKLMTIWTALWTEHYETAVTHTQCL